MIKYALNLVFRRKVRTFLTSLGITISVILLSSIIFGMSGLRNVMVDEFTSRFAPTQIAITNQDISFFAPPDSNAANEEQTYLTPEIIEELKQIPNVEVVEPQTLVNGFQIALEGSDTKPYAPAFIAGLDNILDTNYIVDYVAEDRVLDDGEVYASKFIQDYFGIETPEELIGKKVILTPDKTSLFGFKSAAVNDTQYEFTIVGVIDSGVDKFDLVTSIKQSVQMLADIGGFTDTEKLLETFGYDQVVLNVKDESKVEEVKQYLEDNYNFNLLTADDVLEFLDQITVIMTLGLLVFSVVSAVVASIGIINTMVMSIYEQTREIGIIKSLGASRKQILSIFLIQSAVIGLIGGVIGLIVTLLAVVLLDPVIVSALQEQGLQATAFFRIEPLVILIIILGSMLVGIIAGLYPAYKAASIDPVKALRYE